MLFAKKRRCHVTSTYQVKNKMIPKFLKKLVRIKQPVLFNDLNRTVPISRVFGIDRGTPVDRYYIDQFLKGHSLDIKGRILEIADDYYSRKYGSDKVEKYEILHASTDSRNATIVGDLADVSTLLAGEMDCFICTQTFNFIYEVEKAVAGAHHLLKPGGVLLATVAGLSHISRYDMDRWGDYWRFTTASVQRLFEQVFGVNVDVKSYGNVLAACAFLQGIAVEDIPNSILLDENDPDYQVIITIVARKSL